MGRVARYKRVKHRKAFDDAAPAGSETLLERGPSAKQKVTRGERELQRSIALAQKLAAEQDGKKIQQQAQSERKRKQKQHTGAGGAAAQKRAAEDALDKRAADKVEDDGDDDDEEDEEEETRAKRKKQKTKHRKGAEVDVSTMADLTPVAHRAKSEISKLTRAPGESLKAFNARVDQAAAAHIVQVGRQATKTGEKRRKFLGSQKEKEREKQSELEAELAFRGKKEHIRFGEVVQEPPRLQVTPRLKPQHMSKPKSKLLLEAQLETSGSSSAKKPAIMTPARMAMLQEERTRVIELYRQMKKRRQQEQGSGGRR